MNDLQAMFNTAVALVFFGICSCIGYFIIIQIVGYLIKGIFGIISLNARMTRMNPYIDAHQSMLIDQKHYAEYKKEAIRDMQKELNNTL